MPRLKSLYTSRVMLELQKKLGVANIHQVPNLKKITLNMGLGKGILDKKIITSAVSDMESIGGQKPVMTFARKSIAGFKVRAGWPIGCKVTLRGNKMWDFFDRLVDIAIPRIRDFRGLNPKSFDGFGNYSMGIREQIIFPEIDYDKIDRLRGMDIIITTAARDNL